MQDESRQPGVNGRAYDPGQVLISLHIPKTAGMSFGEALQRWFPGNLAFHYRDGPSPPVRTEPRPGLCIHGHFNRCRGIGVPQYYPQARQFITFLRDPFDRFVSQWLYLRYQVRAGVRVPELDDGPSFEAWLDRRWRATQAGEDPFSTSAQLPAPLPADRNPFGPEFLFVGLVERYAESLGRLAAILGREAPEAVHINTARDPQRREEPPPDHERYRSRYEAAFPLEYDIYRAAVREFWTPGAGEQAA